MHAGQIDNVFSLDEIGMLVAVLGTIPNQKLQDGILTNGFCEDHDVFPIINELVISKINVACKHKIQKLTVGMQLITSDPFKIHTDFSGKNDSGYGTAYLIPLYMMGDAIQEPSATIVFNEYSCEHHGLEPYIKSNPPKPVRNARNIWHHLPESRDAAKNHWADYLSVNVFGEWRMGSMIYWDRRLYHASDDFLTKGITQKSALVLFSSDDS